MSEASPADPFGRLPDSHGPPHPASANADSDLARGEALVAEIYESRGRLDTKELLALSEDALLLLESEQSSIAFTKALGLNAALNALAGNVGQSLEQGLRLEARTDLPVRVRNSLAIVFHRAGAFDLAAKMWAQVVESAARTRDYWITIGSTHNLLSAISRADLVSGNLSGGASVPARSDYLATATRSMASVLERISPDASVAPDDGHLVEMARINLAIIRLLEGNPAHASELWGSFDALEVESSEILRLFVVAMECRIAIFRDDLERAGQLVDYALRDRPPEAELRLGKVEAHLRLAEIHARTGDQLAQARALERSAELALSEHQQLPNVLIDELRQRVEIQASQRILLEQAQELTTQINTDPLTGVGSRRALDEQIDALANNDEQVAILFIDIDRFKPINDRHGHGAGDQILVAVADAISRCCEADETIARYGGEEFVVIAPGLFGSEAEQLGERIRSTVAHREWTAMTLDLPVTVSLGVASGSATDIHGLVSIADQAMYEAKRRGRNCVVSRTSIKGSPAHPATASAIAEAIQLEQLTLHYQPIWHVNTGRVVGLEALVRWDHPTHGRIGPDEFIPAAEFCGLVSAIDTYVIRRACANLAELRASGDPAFADLYVTVNVSPTDLADVDLSVLLDDLSAELGLPPNAVVVELTETVLITDLANTAAELRGIRKLGTRVALDDFGTGYSSLSQLHALEVDMIKVDRSFVQDSGSKNAILGMIIQLGDAVGCTTVVEGVETDEQLARVIDFGAHLVQGYLLAKPLPLTECREVIRTANGPVLQKA